VRRLIPFFVACAIIALMVVGVASAQTPAISKAKSQAEALRAQIDELDAQVEAAVEEYNTANAKLEQTQAAAQDNEKKLAVVEADLDAARTRLSSRIVEIYKEGHLGVLDTLVGSASFSDVINRLNLMERLSKQDSQLVAQVTAYQQEVTARKAELAKQMADQKRYIADAAAAERKVEAQLAAKKKALIGKESQIAQLQKEEAARQAALAAAAKKAAEEARKAREAAAAAARATTTTTHRATTTTHTVAPGGHTTTTGHTGTAGRSTTTTHRTTTTARATPPSTDPPPSGGTSGGDVVDYALKFLGTPYVWAGSSPSGFDCSGFTMYVYRHFGISLPHSSSMQSGYGVAVARADLQPGDLVFYYSPIHHVGLYIGGGKMVNAAGTGKGVRIDYIWSSYNSARRILR
jgi:cell wall-associated NlpC family hydrolase